MDILITIVMMIMMLFYNTPPPTLCRLSRRNSGSDRGIVVVVVLASDMHGRGRGPVTASGLSRNIFQQVGGASRTRDRGRIDSHGAVWGGSPSPSPSPSPAAWVGCHHHHRHGTITTASLQSRRPSQQKRSNIAVPPEDVFGTYCQHHHHITTAAAISETCPTARAQLGIL